MTRHKLVDRLGYIAIILACILSFIFMNGESIGIQATSKVIGYENRIFDTSYVHTIDIVMDNWDEFIASCENEEYALAHVVIDGESFKNVGIRAKGNTSLSTVSQLGSDRYSFKIEFNQYDSTKTYYGLDKLCLNNLIQDSTMMKDYLVYQMMNEFEVDAPLSSYVYITVNGEDWGLYLAVEAIEDSFLQRQYGNSVGELYKPDSMSMGGGRGNGKDFNMDDIDINQVENNATNREEGGRDRTTTQSPAMPQMNNNKKNFSSMNINEESVRKVFEENDLDTSLLNDIDWETISFDTIKNLMSGLDEETLRIVTQSFMENPMRNMENRGNGGMGSSDTKLQYIDDAYSSYSNIFNNAKTEITDEDKERLIASLKTLSNGEDIESVVNIEEVIRYFVVHDFVQNGDSYTGSIIHNYYLYEEDGVMSMIPWDYNLAFGTFQGANASSTINSPIDSIVSDMSDRPMVSWIFENEEYTELYHQYYDEFIRDYFESGRYTDLVNRTFEMIAPYVEKDPTKFYTYEEFEQGVNTIAKYGELRSESVRAQLEGTIPSTSEEQSKSNVSLIDASSLNLSDMGSMGMGKGQGGANFPGMPNGDRNSFKPSMNTVEESNSSQTSTQRPSGNTDSFTPFTSENVNGFGNFDPSQIPQGEMSMPNGDMSSFTPPITSEENSFENFIPSQMNGQESEDTLENSETSTNSENIFPNQMQGFMPNGQTRPNGMPTSSGQLNYEGIMMLGLSFISMLVGLLFVKIFKRRRYN